jgi:hypothetical protein
MRLLGKKKMKIDLENLESFDLKNDDHFKMLYSTAQTTSDQVALKKLFELNDSGIHYGLSQNKNLPLSCFNSLAQAQHPATRMEIAKHHRVTPAILTKLSFDKNSQVLLACAANPKNSAKNLNHLSKTSSFAILCEVAKNPNTSIDTLREIHTDQFKNESPEPTQKLQNFINQRIEEKIQFSKQMDKQESEIPWLKNRTPNDSVQTLENGTIIFFKNGVKHRDDAPAVISPDGSESWYQDGLLHRDHDAPAIIGSDGSEKWYQHGNPHRDVGPAVMYPNGTRYYYQNGHLHRDNDKPAIKFPDGEKYWYQEGKLHRDNKPAIVKPDGTQMYYKHGLLHRDDGPAIHWNTGEQEYALQGYKMDHESFLKTPKAHPQTDIKTSITPRVARKDTSLKQPSEMRIRR